MSCVVLCCPDSDGDLLDSESEEGEEGEAPADEAQSRWATHGTHVTGIMRPGIVHRLDKGTSGMSEISQRVILEWQNV